MTAFRLILKLLTALISICLVFVVLYFPTANLLAYIGHETRIFAYNPSFSPKDAILPSFLIAVVYAVIEKVRKRIEPVSSQGDTRSVSADHEPVDP